jgi:hypothetical protein
VALLVNFDSMRNMILSVSADGFVTVRNERKIKPKPRRRDGTALLGEDEVGVVSGPEGKLY